MRKELQKDKLRSRIDTLHQFHQEKGRMPSFSEIAEMLGLRSKNAVFKLITKLEEMSLVERDSTWEAYPPSLLHSLRVLGTVEAGFPSPAGEELADTVSLDDLLVKNKAGTFRAGNRNYSQVKTAGRGWDYLFLR